MLKGTRIVEFEGLGPAPFAAMMLADLGAEVTVIHRPGRANPTIGEVNLLDRGKQSIVLDLKDTNDLQIAHELVVNADALVEGYRPGVMERLGLGPKVFKQSNPRLVYGRMTGWGQSGPRAQTAGHDYNYIATSGALWYAATPGDVPLTPPTLVGDIGGGALYLVAGILAGLLRAEKTGEGTVVDAAIVDGSAHMMALLMAMAPTGNLSEIRGQSLLDAPPWGRVYCCADGRHISVQCLEPKFYRKFLEVLKLDQDADFIDQFDRKKWPDQTARLKDVFASRTATDWETEFAGSDACVAAVLSPHEAAREPHMSDRAVWRNVQGIFQPTPAPRFEKVPSDLADIPTRDGDRAKILAELHERDVRSKEF